jgi:WhiB family redox-sensing transcriptional regulator
MDEAARVGDVTLAESTGELAWQSEALCRGLPSHVFYPPDHERGRRRRQRELHAKKICAACPVCSDCLAYALNSDEPYGVWGATTALERRDILTAAHGKSPAGTR